LLDEVVKPEVDAISYTRNKPKRKQLPKDLSREVMVHDISDDEKVCDCCQGALHKMDEDKSEQLKLIPAQINVIEHVRLKYSCRACEKSGTKTTIMIVPVTTTPIPKSIATPSLLSQIITSKYQSLQSALSAFGIHLVSLPLYRQETMF